MESNQKYVNELSGESRFPYKLRAMALIHMQSAYSGYVTDLSIKGVTLCLEKNIKDTKLIKLRIQFPPTNVADSPRIIEVNGNLIYTIYSAENADFRSFINFTQFSSESDQQYLALRINNA